METGRLVRHLALASLLVLLGGCVAGQTLRLDYTAEPAGTRAGGTPVRLAVTDKRPYVVSGEKKPSYLGKYRAGFGNTWDVHADDDVALAAKMMRDLDTELVALGFKVSNDAAASRRLAVEIVDWNFDSYVNATIWYELLVTVRDNADRVLNQATVKDKVNVEGSAMVGPKYAVQREMPKIYGTAIRKIARDNPQVLRALGR